MTMPPADMSVLWKVIRRLDQAKIPYMLTGSLALNFYGHARATNDIDIVIQIVATDTATVLQLFRDDFYMSEDAVHEAIARQTMFNIIDNDSVFKIDFIIAKQDPFALQQFARRQCMTIGAQDIWVISPEDLVLAKLAWSQESQSAIQEKDVLNILAVCSDDLDKDYLLKHAATLHLGERLKALYAKI